MACAYHHIGVRATLMAIACSAGMTCETAVREDAVVVHAPLEQPAVVQPAVQPVALESGPFWQPVQGPHAVPILRSDAPNMRYAALDQATCERELTQRNVAFVRAEPMTGVMAPVRLRGPMTGGVTIHSLLPPSQREHAAMEVFDCRLVLALDDFSSMISKRGIVEMIHLSAYRPRSQFGCTPKYDGKQHCGALAVDIASFKRADGSTLSVEKDFHGRVGLSTCTTHPAPNELWSIVCEAADRGIFNVILSPNYNAQHFNHLHVEVTPQAAWMLVP
jgi:hypothetical protein